MRSPKEQYGMQFAEWFAQRQVAVNDAFDSLERLSALAPMQAAKSYMLLAEFLTAMDALREQIILTIDTAYPPVKMDEVDAGWVEETETLPVPDKKRGPSN